MPAEFYSWEEASSIDLKWSSLENWGSGNVKVTVDYVARNGSGATTATSRSQTLSAVEGMTGAAVSWTGVNWAEYAGLQSVSRIRVWKVVDGADVLVQDSAGDQLQTATLSWQKSPVEGTQVELYYRTANPAQSSTQW